MKDQTENNHDPLSLVHTLSSSRTSLLTHWDRATHICVGKLIIIVSDDGLSPGRRQAIIWNNDGILLIRPSETNFNEILIGNEAFSCMKMHLKMSAKRRPFCLGLNELTYEILWYILLKKPLSSVWWWSVVCLKLEFLFYICIWNKNESYTSIVYSRLPSLVCSSMWSPCWHYNDVIMGAIASQITSFTIVYSIVYSDADKRKHQSSASLAFVRGIHRGPQKSLHKWPVTRKMFPFDDVIMTKVLSLFKWKLSRGQFVWRNDWVRVSNVKSLV